MTKINYFLLWEQRHFYSSGKLRTMLLIVKIIDKLRIQQWRMGEVVIDLMKFK